MEFRKAKPEEINQIIDLANFVFRISRNLEPSMGRQFPFLLSPENASNLHVAVDGGRVVSHIGIRKLTAIINGHKLTVAGMGSVCTHPDYRGQGLATKLLYQTFQSLYEDGVALVKISGNRGLYITNGCMQLENIACYTFDMETCPHDLVPSIQPEYQYQYIDNPQDSTILAEIYQREPIRYQRAKWEFPILFKAMPTVHPPAGRIHTAVVAHPNNSNEAGIAYVIGYEREPGVYEIIEYAGARLAIPGMIQYLFKAKNMKKVSIKYPAYDNELTQILEPLSPGGRIEELSYMTIKITNEKVLWDQISPIIAERWPDKNSPQSLEELEKVCAKQGRDLVEFLFSDYQRPNYGEEWDKILPIQLPWHLGLNYV